MGYKYKARVQFHMHSNHSDGAFNIDEILAECQRRGFQFISVTDHNEIDGTLEAVTKAKQYNLVAFPGIELFFFVNGKIDELLIYFEKPEEMKQFFAEYMQHGRFLPIFLKIEDLVEIVKKNHGIICAPHPFCEKGICKNHLAIHVDEMETVNAMEPRSLNRMAAKYRAKYHLIGMGNSDMHFYKKSLGVYTLLKSNKPITAEEIFANLRKEKETIRFTVQDHFKITTLTRVIQWGYELFAVPRYLVRQLIWRGILNKE